MSDALELIKEKKETPYIFSSYFFLSPFSHFAKKKHTERTIHKSEHSNNFQKIVGGENNVLPTKGEENMNYFFPDTFFFSNPRETTEIIATTAITTITNKLSNDSSKRKPANMSASVNTSY